MPAKRRRAAVALLATALVLPAAAFSKGGDLSYSYTQHASRLHADLLADYVKAIPPQSKERERAPQSSWSRAGTDVKLQLRFFKVESVDITTSSMSLKVWFRLSWIDERLSWDPAEYGGIETVPFL